jgi:hypothetical protein
MNTIERIPELEEDVLLEDDFEFFECISGHTRDVVVCARGKRGEHYEVSLLTGKVRTIEYGSEEVSEYRLFEPPQLDVILCDGNDDVSQTCIPLIKRQMVWFTEQVRNPNNPPGKYHAITEGYFLDSSVDFVQKHMDVLSTKDGAEKLFKSDVFKQHRNDVADGLLREIEKSEPFWHIWSYIRWNDHLFAFCSFRAKDSLPQDEDVFENLSEYALFVVSPENVIVDFSFGINFSTYCVPDDLKIYPGNDCLTFVFPEMGKLCGWRVNKK